MSGDRWLLIADNGWALGVHEHNILYCIGRLNWHALPISIEWFAVVFVEGICQLHGVEYFGGEISFDGVPIVSE
jgi:hypothetical protein